MKTKRILFACYHFYLDPSNGAAITTREILLALAKRGWEVSTFCGCGLDFQKSTDPLQVLVNQNIKPQQIVENKSGFPFSIARFFDGPIHSTVFLPRENQHIPSQEAGHCYIHLMQESIRQFAPDILITYGGYWLGEHLLRQSHECNLVNVLLLQNLVYDDASFFRDVDLTIVPSRFASNYYQSKLGIDTVPIAPMMDWNLFLCDQCDQKYVTFVNPEPGKGVYIFAQIAKQLWERRPEIPLLVVEGRADAGWLAQTGVDLRGVKNLNLMANTPDPRDFYRVSKIVLMPSLFMESFGRMAAESMINGIPVIGSNRGALPEVIGDAGLTLEIPAHYTPDSRIIPSPDEVEPWVENIIRLWDDATFYETRRQKSLKRAKIWQQDIIASRYDQVLSDLIQR